MSTSWGNEIREDGSLAGSRCGHRACVRYVQRDAIEGPWGPGDVVRLPLHVSSRSLLACPHLSSLCFARNSRLLSSGGECRLVSAARGVAHLGENPEKGRSRNSFLMWFHIAPCERSLVCLVRWAPWFVRFCSSFASLAQLVSLVRLIL